MELQSIRPQYDSVEMDLDLPPLPSFDEDLVQNEELKEMTAQESITPPTSNKKEADVV